jgi:hypothetical protein
VRAKIIRVPGTPLHPSIRRSLRIALALIAVLILAPVGGYILAWRFDLDSVPLDGLLVAIHALGLLGLLGWSVLFLKVEPVFARIGLAVAFLLLGFWAFAIFR